MVFWHSCSALLTGTDEPLRFLSRFGRAIKNTGSITAAATSMRTTTQTARNALRDMPQILFRRSDPLVPFLLLFIPLYSSPPLSLGVCPRIVAGGGKEASMPPRDEPSDGRWRNGFSPSPIIQSMPSLLAVFPLSRFAASLVARLIKSGRLVRDARASASRTASMLRFGGRLDPTLPASPLGCLLSARLPFSSFRCEPILPSACPGLNGSINDTSLVRRSFVCSEDEASSKTLSPSSMLAT